MHNIMSISIRSLLIIHSNLLNNFNNKMSYKNIKNIISFKMLIFTIDLQVLMMFAINGVNSYIAINSKASLLL